MIRTIGSLPSEREQGAVVDVLNKMSAQSSMSNDELAPLTQSVQIPHRRFFGVAVCINNIFYLPRGVIDHS
jgi:hypothetical protein